MVPPLPAAPVSSKGFLIGDSMALLKIYALPEKQIEVRSEIARSIKLIAAAALNVPTAPTTPGGIETVLIEGLDLVGIDYIIEIIAVKRPDQQTIANNFISGLNQVYPNKSFSVYFNNINEQGMANTERNKVSDEPISISDAIARSRDEI